MSDSLTSLKQCTGQASCSRGSAGGTLIAAENIEVHLSDSADVLQYTTTQRPPLMLSRLRLILDPAMTLK